MKTAVLGAGRIGSIHAGNAAKLAGVELVAIYDAIPDAAQKLANTLSCAVKTSAEIFADKSINSVLICAPTNLHSELIEQSARAGKHIFCEKPVDLSVARAQACAQVVKAANVACMIGFQRRFDPTFNTAKKRLDAGEIGVAEMLVITSRDPGAPPSDYIKNSGGIFRDMLIHDFDVFRWILGDEATSIMAMGSCLTEARVAEAGDIDSAAVTLKTRSGKLCLINTSRRAAYGYDQRFEVLGSKGMLACHNHKPSEVVASTVTGISHDGPENFFLQRYKDAYRLELESFFSALQGGGKIVTTIEDGVAAQKLSDAAAQSYASGLPVTL